MSSGAKPILSIFLKDILYGDNILPPIASRCGPEKDKANASEELKKSAFLKISKGRMRARTRLATRIMKYFLYCKIILRSMCLY